MPSGTHGRGRLDVEAWTYHCPAYGADRRFVSPPFSWSPLRQGTDRARRPPLLGNVGSSPSRWVRGWGSSEDAPADGPKRRSLCSRRYLHWKLYKPWVGNLGLGTHIDVDRGSDTGQLERCRLAASMWVIPNILFNPG
jgi:hypothetical protein